MRTKTPKWYLWYKLPLREIVSEIEFQASYVVVTSKFRLLSFSRYYLKTWDFFNRPEGYNYKVLPVNDFVLTSEIQEWFAQRNAEYSTETSSNGRCFYLFIKDEDHFNEFVLTWI